MVIPTGTRLGQPNVPVTFNRQAMLFVPHCSIVYNRNGVNHSTSAFHHYSSYEQTVSSWFLGRIIRSALSNQSIPVHPTLAVSGRAKMLYIYEGSKQEVKHHTTCHLIFWICISVAGSSIPLARLDAGVAFHSLNILACWKAQHRHVRSYFKIRFPDDVSPISHVMTSQTEL